MHEILPDLKALKVFKGDYIFQQHDRAEEIYMIKDGSVSLNLNCKTVIDELNEGLNYHQDDKAEVEDDDEQGYLFPFIAYLGGSYFGDNKALTTVNWKMSHRDSTAIASADEC